MVAFLNFNFLLFLILFFPLSLYLFSSIHDSFLFLFFSPPETYASSSIYLPFHLCFSTLALSFFLSLTLTLTLRWVKFAIFFFFFNRFDLISFKIVIEFR